MSSSSGLGYARQYEELTQFFDHPKQSYLPRSTQGTGHLTTRQGIESWVQRRQTTGQERASSIYFENQGQRGPIPRHLRSDTTGQATAQECIMYNRPNINDPSNRVVDSTMNQENEEEQMTSHQRKTVVLMAGYAVDAEGPKEKRKKRVSEYTPTIDTHERLFNRPETPLSLMQRTMAEKHLMRMREYNIISNATNPLAPTYKQRKLEAGMNQNNNSSNNNSETS